MKALALALVLASLRGSEPEPWKGGAIPMVFSGTEVGHALKAIGLRTGVGIVYAAGKERLDVTLNVKAATPDEAIRNVASAAGLAVRRVGKTYIVAAPSAMRQALEPYASTLSIPVDGEAEGLAARLQERYPYAVVHAAGNQVTIQGIADDLESAQASLRGLQASANRKPTSDVVMLERAVPSVVAPLIASLFPDLKVVPTTGDKAGGALALSGPAESVEAARTALQRVDRESAGDGNVFRVYTLRYATAQSVLDLLHQAAPTVEAYAGPEAYQPKRAIFSPLTAGVAGIVSSTATTSSATGSSAGGLGSTTDASSVSTSTAGPGGAINGASTAGHDRAKNIVLRGRASEVEAALGLLAEVDRKPKQVVVEVNVFETSPEKSENVGLTYDWTSLSFYEAPAGSSVGTIPTITRPAGVGQFSRVPWNFNAKLNALVTNRQARILARPSIRVVDDGQASVFIGDTLRARIVTGGALGAQNIEIREFPVGIILLLAPRVNADGNITMHVNPVVSTITSVDENNIPQTSAREAETTAIVKDGETVVLGGLIRDEDVRTVQEVPLLSKLPIVGELFRNRNRSHRRSDILVSITPHIIGDEEPTKPFPGTPSPGGGKP